MKRIILLALISMPFFAFYRFAYDTTLVMTKTHISQNEEPYGILKMSRNGGRVKVKYFAYKEAGTPVSDRYLEWSKNRNIISVSSGTYMTDCDASKAYPDGLCIDQGHQINLSLSKKFDGLIIVYATGGMVATDLRKGNLTIDDNGKKIKLDLRKPLDLDVFLDWATRMEATVFQTSLFVYNNELAIYPNAEKTPARRRYLAVCYAEDKTIVHYIINLTRPSTLYDGAIKAQQYLNSIEDVNSIVYMINLDPGCQNIYMVRKSDGTELNDYNFKGEKPISQAANLLVYYYE